MGTRVGGDEAWDRAVLAAQKEVDHESSLTGGSDDDDAPVPLLGLSFRRALEKASSLPVDAAACQTRAYSYVRELGERGDIETLIDLYHDANRRVEEATKRDAKIQSFVGGERSGVAVAKNARDAVKGELFDRFMEVARATESDRFDADTRRDAAVAAAVFYREICETVNRLEASLRMTEEKALDAEARLADERLADARPLTRDSLPPSDSVPRPRRRRRTSRTPRRTRRGSPWRTPWGCSRRLRGTPRG